MSIEKIKTIIRKEWADVFKHRLVLLSMLFIPLAFTTVPVSALMVTGAAQIGEVGRRERPRTLAVPAAPMPSGGSGAKPDTGESNLVPFFRKQAEQV